MKMAMVKLHPKLKELGAQLLLQVHDEVVVECEEEAVQEVENTLKETMEGALELSVPLSVKVEKGKRWS